MSLGGFSETGKRCIISLSPLDHIEREIFIFCNYTIPNKIVCRRKRPYLSASSCGSRRDSVVTHSGMVFSVLSSKIKNVGIACPQLPDS